MILLMLINVWLLCRLTFISHDTALPTRVLLGVLMVVVMAGLLLSPVWAMLPVVSLLLLSLLASERWLPARHLNLWRLASALVVLLALALVRPHLPASTLLTFALNALSWSVADVERAMWVVLGVLLLANEVNLLIRALFHQFHLEPIQTTPTPSAEADSGATVKAEIDQREYNAGRIIGILERWLMYAVIVVSQNYNVIAFILAAKGFARFRQLEEREFAEYVLIGTLASTLLTILISQGVVKVLG